MEYTSEATDLMITKVMPEWMFYVLMIGFAIGGALFIQYFYARIKRSVMVCAKVVGMKNIRNEDGVTYCPIFEVQTGEFIGNQFESLITSNPAMHQKGDICDVYYDPKTGKMFSHKSGIWLMATSVGILIFGMIIFWLVGKGM